MLEFRATLKLLDKAGICAIKLQFITQEFTHDILRIIHNHIYQKRKNRHQSNSMRIPKKGILAGLHFPSLIFVLKIVYSAFILFDSKCIQQSEIYIIDIRSCNKKSFIVKSVDYPFGRSLWKKKALFNQAQQRCG